MIKEIKIKNLLSFKEETVLDFEATKESFEEGNQIVTMPDGTRLSRIAIVLGSTGSGKSNLVKVVKTLKQLVSTKDYNHQHGLFFSPCKLHNEQIPPSEISIVFYLNGKKHEYLLKTEYSKIIFERLNIYNSVQPTTLFLRELNDKGDYSFRFCNEFDISKEKRKIIVELLNEEMSMFEILSRFNTERKLLADVLDFFNNGFSFFDESDPFFWKSIDFSESKTIRDFSDHCGFGISEIQFGLDSYYFIHSTSNDGGNKGFKIHESFESNGIKSSLRKIGVIDKLLHDKSSHIAFMDNFDNNISEELVAQLLFCFLKEKSDSQLVVTVNGSHILEFVDDIFRKDAIWFVNKKQDFSSELHHLTDFNGLNRISSIAKAYRKGNFGSIIKTR